MTRLQTDEQTIADLRIFSKADCIGIYEIYNQTNTRGGSASLEQMFRNPLSDADAIRQRNSVIRQFATLKLNFPFEAQLFDMAEKYLIDSPARPGLSAEHNWNEKDLQNGVSAVIALLQYIRNFIRLPEVLGIAAFAPEREQLEVLLQHPSLVPVFKEPLKTKLSYAVVAAYDALFRTQERHSIKKVLEHIYMLDAYLAVAQVSIARGFVFPTVHDSGGSWLKLAGVYHPEVNNAIGNDVALGKGKSIMFLTGANMAGKSTFLRSLSTALYLAHMGFPVAAQSMDFTVMDGIYTTVNLPDNLGIGASHFYAEVLRLKQLATEIGKKKALFIIFDELFRGTNVKDAHEATVAVTRAFADRQNSLFVISSHIVEAAEELKHVPAVDFQYLPTRMNGHVPEYTYRLEQGTTSDRHGMVIIRNEGILEMLKNGKKQINK